jgi:hypothetical protein
LTKWNGTLGNANCQTVAIPMQPAGSNLEGVLIAVNPFAAALRHSPAFIARAIDCYIERAIVIGICGL